MYKVILTDDEYIIRAKLASIVDWNKCGFVLDGVFENGNETIEYLKKNTVDLVITDIKMNNLSGIDVAKYIFENKPDIYVVFLSSYNEIEYAKLGMKYNVKRYINKPIPVEKLQEVLLEIKADLDKKKVHKDVFACYMYTGFFRGFLMNENRSEISKNIETDLSNANFCMFLINPKNTIVDNRLVKCFYNIFTFSYKDTQFCLLEQETDELRIIIYSDKPIEENWYEKFEKQVKEYLNIEICVEDILYADGLEELKKYFLNNSGTSNEHIAIREAKKYIDENLSSPLTLKIIAEKVYISTFYLSKLFKKCYGINISEYIVSERMKTAKQLLISSSKSINDIIECVGYENVSNFYKAFKKNTGVSPAEYRKMFGV